MPRSGRIAVDQGSLWENQFYFDPIFVEDPAEDYVAIDLPQPIVSAGVTYSRLTIYGSGLVVVGDPATGLSGIRYTIENVSPDDYIFVGYPARGSDLNIAYVDVNFEPGNSPGRPDGDDVNIVLSGTTFTVTNTSAVDFSFNQFPVLANRSDLLAAAGAEFVYRLDAFDPNGDPISYEGDFLPSWLSLDSRGVLRGTPDASDLGFTSFQVIVSDDRGGQTFASFELNVVQNAAPVLARPLAAQAATQGRSFAYTVPLDSFTDPDAGDTISYDAMLANGAALPSWLAFDAGRRRFTGTPGNDDVGRVTVSLVASDRFGVSTAANFTLTVANVNDAPVANGGVAPLTAAVDRAFAATLRADLFTDVDAGDRLSVVVTRADGSALPSWLRYDATSRTLSGTPLGNDQGALSLVARATDLAGASAAATFTLTVSDPPRIVTGGAGDDRLAVPNGRSIVSGGAGSDVAVFSGSARDYTGTSGANGEARLVDGRGATYILHSVETIAFTDGTIDISRPPSLVDPLFYLTQQRDIFYARADAAAHYAEFGWREGRDPNAFFSTRGYLGDNPDVAAAKVNPLAHYASDGWREGRDPSAAFDTTLYLARNADVRAAGIDPLAHFIQYGIAEGRSAYEAIGTRIAANGFDPDYYLLANTDVAAAAARSGGDIRDFAFRHYQDFGWREGRDPNAWFDDRGYLAAYRDVAAAGINPLDHYAANGWREGRDPSADFDTSSYLAAYGDVAAAGINPLLHYLQSGAYELRGTFADGLF